MMVLLYIFMFTTLAVSPRLVASGGIWISQQGCGVKKGCILWPPNCHALGCDILFTFEEDKSKEVVHFELQAKTSGWIAVGFSYDMHMGHDDVYSCVNVNGEVELQRSYNRQHENIRQSEVYGIKHWQGFYADGYTSCRFTRTKAVTKLDVDMFAFYQSWYILLPYGPVNSTTGQMLRHEGMPIVSSKRILLSATDHSITSAEVAHDAQHSYLSRSSSNYDLTRLLAWQLVILVGLLLNFLTST